MTPSSREGAVRDQVSGLADRVGPEGLSFAAESHLLWAGAAAV
jgi:hypothetical protein